MCRAAGLAAQDLGAFLALRLACKTTRRQCNELDRTVFKLREHGTNVRTELVAGLTTFLTMAYIIFVNPSILGDAGMPKGSVFRGHLPDRSAGSTIMALYANYPIALAPGMGLNAYFAYVVVLKMGFTWQAALGAVFVSGCLFLICTLLGLRSSSSRAYRSPYAFPSPWASACSWR
jgi:xanthine/uracil/vitamin C permease (AzgA family)